VLTALLLVPAVATAFPQFVNDTSIKHCSERGNCACDCSWATPSKCGQDDGSCCWDCCCEPSPTPPSPSSVAPDIHRVGNKIVDRRTGKGAVLKGVAMMGGEYMCVSSQTAFDGPADASVVDGMAKWGINAIRLPMNEDCWLGINGAKLSGKAYSDRFVEFVELLLSRGFVVVLDLHWTSTTSALARGQDLFMSPNSLKFWASVASHPVLHNRAGVVFELFNEPHDTESETLTPSCFLEGKDCQFAGYNQAVSAIRTTANATNLVLFAGKNWNFDLGWLMQNFPSDPMDNCAASWHPYEFKCRYFDCQKGTEALTASYPIFVTEWSPGYPQSNKAPPLPDEYSSRMLKWSDDNPSTVMLFPWVWNPGSGSERLNSAAGDYTGNVPNAWGKEYKAWLHK